MTSSVAGKPAVTPESEPSTDYGPLGLLSGRWVNRPGKLGLNVMSMPAPGTMPSDEPDFVFVHQEMSETLRFDLISNAVRNRGGYSEQFIGAVKYEQAVADVDGNGLHEENGMFLYLKPQTVVVGGGNAEGRSEFSSPYTIARSGTVPHGNSLLLHGTTAEVAGAAELEEVSTVSPAMARLHYDERVGGGPELKHPTTRLQAHNAGLRILKTTVFELDSRNEGHIGSVPFVKALVDVPFMRSLFYHQIVEDPLRPGTTFEQLQYIQQMDLLFHRSASSEEPGLVPWPHITVNTLLRPS